jgi:4-amino-4-deoxy-L-arabinose transferase-like glycosyltransferase
VRQGLTRPLWLGLVVIAFCVPLFVGLGRTDMENDEAIYSYAVDKILESGDWLNPLLSPHEDIVFLEKPPLKFWIVAAPIRLGLLPKNELGFRVPDAVFGSLAFLYVFAIGRRLGGPICGLVAGLVLFLYPPLIFTHGLRNNNMEAPLVLSYCGGVYHFLAWASTTRGVAARRAHIGAVWGWFFLGFMTKFVASFFLPMIFVAALSTDRAALRRLREDFWVWGVGGVAFLLLASPWFIYQMNREGMGLWRVMLGEHVYQRFTTSLDQSHLQPWNYYLSSLATELSTAGTLWLAVAGGALLLYYARGERRFLHVTVLSWFVIPIVLTSLGSSKLHHYLYPFLAPVALAAGYGPGWLVAMGRKYSGTITEGLQRRIGGFQSRPIVTRVLLFIACVAVAIAFATFFFGQINWRIGNTQVFRNSHVARPLMVALILALLAGRGPAAMRFVWPLAVLAAVINVNAYEAVWRRAALDEHPLRSLGDCLQRVRQAEIAAGRPAHGVYAISEHRWFLHSYYYYFHRLGWDRSEQYDPGVLEPMLFTPGQQRPVLMPDDVFWQVRANHPDVVLDRLPLATVLLVLPGPYEACGQPTGIARR